jgi:hypothetical protein
MKYLQPLALSCLLTGAAVPAAAQTPTAVVATVDKTSAASMGAVARLVTEETWNPILDRRIQQSPAASGLGAAWTPSDPRWQKARRTLGARMTKIMDAHATSGQIRKHIQDEVGRIGASPDLNAIAAALNGPAGAALVRQQAKTNYIVTMMSAGGPNSAAIGSPEWNRQLRDFGKQFEDRIGASMPTDDGTHAAELQKLAAGSVGATMNRLWTYVVSNATRQMKTAINLMLFDEQDAIERDVASAIGASGGAANAKMPAPVFSLERMATCQDSWFEWKQDPARMNAYIDSFQSGYRQGDREAFLIPVSRATVAGLPVTQVYPGTIGAGVGFSVLVEGTFDKTKAAIEAALGKRLGKCETSDGTRTCQLEIADKKTVLMLADATGKAKTTLVGCFYVYEK